VQPIWDESLELCATLAPHDGDASAFDLWRIAGRKSLQHDGERLWLHAAIDNKQMRVRLAEGLCHAMPYAYSLPSGVSMGEYRRMLDSVVRWMDHGEPTPQMRMRTRPTLTAVLHMRALQAYDGICAGATQREVAAVLFGPETVIARWDPDSELRSQIRYLISRARFLVNLGYASMLGGKR